MENITREYEIKKEEVKYIEWLQELQNTEAELESFDDLDSALPAHFSEQEASEIWDYAMENYRFYESGIWQDEGLLEEDFPVTVTLNYNNG